jgi:RHS repeat-associated protein
MPGRKYVGSSTYRYGFNGKEKDDETNVNGGSYDFGARMYDSRLGRWLSLDPLQAKYANLSPYNFTGNSPILYLDPDGKRIVDIHGNEIAVINPNTGKVEFTEYAKKNVKAFLSIVNSTDVGNEVLIKAITAKHDIKLIIKETKVVAKETGPPAELKDSEATLPGYNNVRTGNTKTNPTADGKDFKSSEVTIYEGSIQYMRDNNITTDRNNYSKYTQDEATGSVIVHELTHATDKNSSSKFNKTNTYENNAHSNQDCFLKEIDQAKTKSGTKNENK